MAIDTAAKRLRALDFDTPIAPGMPIPDGSIDGDDRAGLLWLYFAAAEAAGETLILGRVLIYAAIEATLHATTALLTSDPVTRPQLAGTATANRYPE